MSAGSSGLLARLKTYCFPGGEDAVSRVLGIKTTQRGEIRSSPAAKWNPFTADEFVDAVNTGFRWEARMGYGLITSVQVTDAYENGRGRLVLKKGPLTLKKMVGPDVDKGELLRYLGYIPYCPAMLLSNPSLEITESGPLTLRLRDRQDQTGATAELDLADDGQPLRTRAVRPMAVGKRVIFTPWLASGSDPQEYEGMRVCRRLEASWNPPEGGFVYIRIELTSITLLS